MAYLQCFQSVKLWEHVHASQWELTCGGWRSGRGAAWALFFRTVTSEERNVEALWTAGLWGHPPCRCWLQCEESLSAGKRQQDRAPASRKKVPYRQHRSGGRGRLHLSRTGTLAPGRTDKCIRYEEGDRLGFRTSVLLTFGPRSFSVVGAVICTVECWVASWVSPY